MKQQPKQNRRSQPRQRLAAPTVDRVRALRFILEQNRLLQRDNAALIGMVKRLRDELEAKNGASSKQGKSKKRQ